MTPELRAYLLAFGQPLLAFGKPETPAPDLPPSGYPQVLVSMEKLIDVIRDAERAAIERAAEAVRLENHSLYLEVLALIDKEPT